ncbi:MAG: hypothetical protein HEP71_31755 [Roseivirga sp.]|nr:hypothetical protein [Roseivirga sp.]
MDHSGTLKPSLRKRQKRRDKRLHEELIECYRGGGGNLKKKKGYQKNARNNDFENEKQKEGIKARSGGIKYQCDNLKPLIRFLEKHEGKYWNKVYSQLCKKMDKNTLLGQHVFDHLEDFVETKVKIEEGKVIGQDRWGGPQELISYWHPKFYVHPKSGQLMRVKKKWSRCY